MVREFGIGHLARIGTNQLSGQSNPERNLGGRLLPSFEAPVTWFDKRGSNRTCRLSFVKTTSGSIWLTLPQGASHFFLHAQIPLFHLVSSRLACDRQRIDSRESCPPTATGCDRTVVRSLSRPGTSRRHQSGEVPKAHSTAVTYRCYLRKWIRPRWESYFLQDIHSVALEDWLHALTVSNGAKVKIRNIMSAVFRHAIRYGFPSQRGAA